MAADLFQRLFDAAWRSLTRRPLFPLDDLAVEHAGPVLSAFSPSHPRAPTVFTLLDDQATTLRIAAKDGAGNAVAFGSPPAWSADPPLLELTPSADGTSCRVAPVPGAGLGTCTVTAKAMPGGTPIGSVAFTINPDYSSLGISVDPAAPIAAPADVAPA